MRPNVSLRAGGLAGACCLAGLAASAGPAQAQSAAPSPAPAGVAFTLSDASLAYGQRTIARGTVGRALAGRRVSLEFRTGATAWRELAAAPAGRDGRYRIAGRVPRTGLLRVVVAGQPAGAAAASRAAAVARRIRVAARVGVARKRLHVDAGRRATASGTVRPGVAGLPVALQVRTGGRWATVDRDRTGRGGRYTLAERRSSTLSAPVRVRVSGARAGVGSSTRSLGRLNVYRTANASWYGPGLYGNSLGCGGRLGTGTLGVAHKTLPCGTKVTFRKGSRSIRVAVIDRGPYVGGREYDLTAATARYLGFGGHGPIQATR